MGFGNLVVWESLSWPSPPFFGPPLEGGNIGRGNKKKFWFFDKINIITSDYIYFFIIKIMNWLKSNLVLKSSFVEISEDLNKQHSDYKKWLLKTFSKKEILEKFYSRKNTFLTMK